MRPIYLIVLSFFMIIKYVSLSIVASYFNGVYLSVIFKFFSVFFCCCFYCLRGHTLVSSNFSPHGHFYYPPTFNLALLKATQIPKKKNYIYSCCWEDNWNRCYTVKINKMKVWILLSRRETLKVLILEMGEGSKTTLIL